MSAIITGGSGFIGRALAADLRRQSRDVLALSSADVDLVDRAATFAWFERQTRDRTWDEIYHLAAVYKAGGWPEHHPATQFHLNMAININVLEAWRRFAPTARLTSALSYCVYPEGEQAHAEEEIDTGTPEPYLFAYAMTKKALLIGQRAYVQEHGLSGASAVLPTVYGPGDSFAENSHVMGALIGKAARAARDGASEFEVWGDGTQRREYLYIDDAVSGLQAVAAGARDLDVVNLASGEAPALRDVVDTIVAEAKFRGAVRYNTSRFVGTATRQLSDVRARTRLAWRPAYPWKDGVASTVNHYRRALETGRES